ncbi:glycosyl transferase family 2 [Breznakibacter xylanolyticus]|uniref:Glycosyl transferase family 2 n=1 Tax=Breznakibacter xylanolyticus TaxID=990 RepID=A0A2W7N2E5_9BACT|nr:glycosyltransferase family A protein [Breznakibacter xylanolyticus]MBN2744045.1 glycosyltransferase family 2 protein [Marinilabiliaceae bacterium]PZX14278.1 glycosyl transferase family 2 [Breznakibacter xylanolyticus]
MRIGINPEKSKETPLVHKRHRIIIPFWIPNVQDAYFREQPKVLRYCLQSLIDSINPQQTNVTLINNHSCREASDVAEEFVAKGLIDKYVVRSENRGKLENILAEGRSAFEEYVTICDADFLFFNGWEDEVIRVFNNFSSAGVVTCYPCPNLAFHYNSCWVLRNRWFLGSVVSNDDMSLVEKGLGGNLEKGIFSGLGSRHRYLWREKQYYLRHDDMVAIPGAVHALATMKRDIIDQLPKRKVDVVFKNGYEQTYLDYFSERLGYVRLSTPNCYAYHMGNTIPGDLIDRNKVTVRTKGVFPDYRSRSYVFNSVICQIESLLVRLLRRMNAL